MNSQQLMSPANTYFMMEELDIPYIDDNEMSRAQFIVNSVNKVVRNQLRTLFPQFKMRPTEPFVLQGSVADGTKVLHPDEFDYMIPMDLCHGCWKILHIVNPISAFGRINRYQIARRDESSQELCNERHCCRNRHTLLSNRRWFHIGDEKIHPAQMEGLPPSFLRYGKIVADGIKFTRESLNETKDAAFESVNNIAHFYGKHERHAKCWEHALSAHRVYNGCFKVINKMQNMIKREIDDIITCEITDDDYENGPAITVKVNYKTDNIGSTTSLKIDYAPAVCINGRTFVARKDNLIYISRNQRPNYNPKKYSPKLTSSSMNWRESFSNDETQLMKEIHDQSPQLFELYRSAKVLLEYTEMTGDAMLHCLLKKASPWKTQPGSSFGLNMFRIEKKILHRLKIFTRRSRFAKMLTSKCPYKTKFYTKVPLSSYKLKTVLFHLWKREELHGADKEKLADEYATLLKDCITQGHVLHYFTGEKVAIG